MRARPLGPLAASLLLVACGDPPGPAATASAGITSVSASASGDTGTATTAASDPLPTTSVASTSTATTAETPTTGALSTTTGTTTDANTASSDASTGDVTATETSADPSTGTDTDTGSTDTSGTSTGASASTEPDTTDTSGTTEAPCPNGQEGCPCGQNNTCDGDLVCTGGVCLPAPPPVCGNGVLEPGEQCDDGNKTNGDGCEANCTPTPAAPPDPCGFPADDGVWFEIDYSNAFTATNPKWTFSPTPGWGEADWAPQGESWPDVWDLGNTEVITDQIGKVAVVGSGDALQIMFGIGGLTYSHATVCVQGRSYSVGSWVIFTVQNQLNLCGDTGMMAQDWTIHSTGVDLGTCIVQNNEFQGLRIFASGGSGALSLKRLRLTLHGAVY